MASRQKPADCCAPASVAPIPAKKLQQAAAVAKALADKNRLEIMNYLSSQDGPVCACDIKTRSDLSQPTVSHHLKELTNADLISTERRGKYLTCSVKEESLKRLRAFFSEPSAS